MGRFVVRRIAQGLLVVIGVTIMVFIFTRMVGDPAKTMLPLSASAEERAAFRHELGLDQPITQQLADYIRDLASGDFGTSLWQRRPAIDAVLDALPNTLQLVLLAIAIAVLLGVPLGVLAALRPGGALDRTAVVLSLAGLSIPQFWLGLLLIIAFSVTLNVLPTAGMGTPAHLILPTLTLAFPALGRIAMIVRSSMIDELNQQYVKTAKAKGMPRVRVVGIHALRNASIPALTLTGWELIRALAGYSVVVETVFAWPGVGFLADQALNNQDLILLQAIVFVVAVMVVVINVGVDVLYRAVDPRIKLV
jgi:peptide/nickel transport system permease protein